MHDDDIPTAGRWRGLCGVCRPIVAAEHRARREERDPIGLEVAARTATKGKLRAAIEDLAPLADRLEEAIEGRDTATMRARVAVRDFREGLQAVGRIAQSLVNVSSSRNGDAGE